jgi:hypothetical protein
MKARHVSSDAKHQLEIALKGLEGKVGKVGWLDGSSYYDPQISVAKVAEIQEFGYAPKKIPSRSFFRTTITEKRASWIALAKKGARSILKGKSSLAHVMEALGQVAAGDVRKKIASIWHPSLKEATILARLHRKRRKTVTVNLTKPLVDTGFMLNTLTNSVEDG